MTRPTFPSPSLLLALLALFSAMIFLPAIALGQADSTPADPDPWPKTAAVGGTNYTLYTIYQPQVDSWDGYHFNGHAAVSVLPPGANDPTFGAVSFSATTKVDRQQRSVSFSDITLQNAAFPSTPDQAPNYTQALATLLAGGNSTMPLDRLQAALDIHTAEQQSQGVPLINDPPTFIFSQTPAVLVLIDGDPVWVPVAGTSLERVLNTRALILRDPSGAIYLHLFDGFLRASSLSGPWNTSVHVPAEVNQTADDLSSQQVVDLMTGPPDDSTGQAPTLANGQPEIYLATEPTELIVTDGTPNWVADQGSSLLYVDNTTANIFKDLNDQQTYILVSGRWFKAADFNGPWQYVDPANLPAEFAQIPATSAKENALASVPGTAQAQEALIADQVPQMAEVDPGDTSFTPDIDGDPTLVPIEDTSLYYVANSTYPIIKVADDAWYACRNGIWFTARALTAAWIVAHTVPPVVYSIPVSSPLHYVTYVRVYGVNGGKIWVGYTPGYYGTVVTPNGLVVYGTGYRYARFYRPAIWYPRPLTYGFGGALSWTPWTGWSYGFGFGWGFGATTIGSRAGWGWGVAPYWGALPYARASASVAGAGQFVAWGPAGWAATSDNIYRRWGSTAVVSHATMGYNAWTGDAWSSQVAHSYNSTTGRISAGQRGSVQNVYTGDYAKGGRVTTINPATGQQFSAGSMNVGRPGGSGVHVQGVNGNYYAEHNGNVYHNNNGAIQSYQNGSWTNVTDDARARDIQAQQSIRDAGNARAAAASSVDTWRAGGGPVGGGPVGGGPVGGGGFGGFHGGGHR